MNDQKTIIFYSFLVIIVILSTVVTSFLLRNNDSAPTENDIKPPITTEVQGNATFTFINSGDGMASVIETSNGKILVIDTGTGENPFLLDYIQGRTVNALFITSLDTNHIGGLIPLLEGGVVEKSFLPGSNADETFIQCKNVLTSHGSEISNLEQFIVDDVIIKPIDVTESNIVYMVTHGMNRLIYQGNQTPENASKMLMSEDLKYLSISGVVAANNGNNAFFSDDLMQKKPKYTIANLVQNNEENKKLTSYCKENNIDFFSFVANPMMPLHFSSTGSKLTLVGYE